MTISSSATGYVFTGGSLTITAGGVVANESATVNSPVTIGAPQTWTTAAGKTLTVNGSVSTIISTLTVAGPGATVISGAVGNGGAMLGSGGGLTVSGPGPLTLTASNTYTGLTTVSGGVLTFAGSGTIASSAGITLSGGRLLLDNSSVNNPSRIASGIPVVLQGGELALQGNAAGTTQALNGLSLGTGGYSVLTVTASSSPAQLSVGTFARSVGAAALVRGTALGTASTGPVAEILFSTAPTLSNSGSGSAVGILPYLYGDNSPTGTGTDLVTYGANGLQLLTAGQYSGTVAAGKNVKLNGSASVSASTSILALVLANGGTAPQLSIGTSKVLTLTSGAVLSTGGSGNSINGGALTFGSSNNSATAYEGIIHTAANLTIGSAITDNGGNPVTLTKSGPALLTLTGNNTYSNGTYVDGGTLQVAAGGAVVGGGAFTIGSGAAAVLAVSGGTVSSAAGGNAFYLGGIAGQTGLVNLSAGSILGTSGGGAMVLGDSGAGTWNQTGGTANFAGAVTGANSPGSIAQMNFSGGSFQAQVSMLVAQGGTGALNLSGSAAVTAPSLAMVGWTSGLASGAVNLGGGTLAVGGITESASGQTASGTATFNFNGGMLRATASNAAFLTGLDYAYVQSGGAVIDTQGYSDTIGQALLSWAGSSSGGGLTKFGSGLLALAASNTYSGQTTVNGGTLQLGDGVSNNGSVGGGISPANGSTLAFANPTAQAFAAGITGSGSLVVCGPGTLTLAGTNNYNGTTTVNGGMLAFSNTRSMPSGAVVTLHNGGGAGRYRTLYAGRLALQRRDRLQFHGRVGLNGQLLAEPELPGPDDLRQPFAGIVRQQHLQRHAHAQRHDVSPRRRRRHADHDPAAGRGQQPGGHRAGRRGAGRHRQPEQPANEHVRRPGGLATGRSHLLGRFLVEQWGSRRQPRAGQRRGRHGHHFDRRRRQQFQDLQRHDRRHGGGQPGGHRQPRQDGQRHASPQRRQHL